MDVTRRHFGRTLSVAPLLLRPAFATSATSTNTDAVVERRVYDRAGAVPQVSILRRHGIRLVSFENTGSDVVLTVSFRSLAARVRAWDRFNSDPEWCALRESREVRLNEIAILPPRA
jgi:hypothetical protein